MILIDDRLGSRDLLSQPALSSFCELCRLDSADVCFSGNSASGPVLIGIELKSISDLISSSSTGRLQATQLPAMLLTYDVSYLLYYGNYKSSSRDNNLLIQCGDSWKPLRQGGKDSKPVKYHYLEFFLMTVSTLGIKIKNCPSLSSSAEWIALLHTWWQRPWHKHKSLRTFDSSKELTEDEYIRISKGYDSTTSLLPGIRFDRRKYQCAKTAASLPGIRFERAVLIAEHFNGSIRDMINAGPEEWAKISGVGKVIANSIERTVK